ncbi:DUF1320 domain-containing protein [uncultured Tateyamaria sp.]|uniref:gp436 family protein n=1 Tax=uncultured Tateyamaria sp. TaxID=455651 RepID=UPI002609B7A0|nr:DUF1320 domain-containing protein [uncultured Tateyamaria sp.]
MTYASEEDLIRRAGAQEIRQVSDRDRDGEIDQDVVDAALKSADDMINGYVAVKYALPLATVPDLLTEWAVSIARYKLHHNGAPDHVDADYKSAVSSLKDVAGGRIALPIDGGTPAQSGMGAHASYSPPQVFTPQKLRGFNDA